MSWFTLETFTATIGKAKARLGRRAIRVVTRRRFAAAILTCVDDIGMPTAGLRRRRGVLPGC